VETRFFLRQHGGRLPPAWGGWLTMSYAAGDCTAPALHALPAALCTPRWSIVGQSVTERPLSFTLVLSGTTPIAVLAASGSIVSVGPPLWARSPRWPAPWLTSPRTAFRQVPLLPTLYPSSFQVPLAAQGPLKMSAAAQTVPVPPFTASAMTSPPFLAVLAENVEAHTLTVPLPSLSPMAMAPPSPLLAVVLP